MLVTKISARSFTNIMLIVRIRCVILLNLSTTTRIVLYGSAVGYTLALDSSSSTIKSAEMYCYRQLGISSNASSPYTTWWGFLIR